MERKYIQSLFFLTLLAGTLVLVFTMLLPYVNTIILAAILAFLFSGIFERLARIMHNRSLAALVATLLVLVTVLVPLSLAGYRIVREAAGLYDYLRQQASSDQIITILVDAQSRIHALLPGISFEAQDIAGRLEQVLSWVVSRIGPAFAGVSRLVVNFLFLLLFFYYLVRDGGRLKRRLMELSPLSDVQETAIIGRISNAIAATVRGRLVIAVLQGLVAGIGFTLFGVPNPALWGSAVMLASFIPAIGTALVQVPAVVYLFATGHTGAGLGLTIWGVAVVGLLDNFLGPRLMASGARMHPLVMMLAVLGGLTTFGPIGILLGPILVSLLYALLDIYTSLIRT